MADSNDDLAREQWVKLSCRPTGSEFKNAKRNWNSPSSVEIHGINVTCYHRIITSNSNSLYFPSKSQSISKQIYWNWSERILNRSVGGRSTLVPILKNKNRKHDARRPNVNQTLCCDGSCPPGSRKGRKHALRFLLSQPDGSVLRRIQLKFGCVTLPTHFCNWKHLCKLFFSQIF